MTGYRGTISWIRYISWQNFQRSWWNCPHMKLKLKLRIYIYIYIIEPYEEFMWKQIEHGSL